ncbi:hypothetical protein [uncultured Dubosiella sp.]|uniref:hypothetical protein n=1 Tax=uncultured Dubosiella sp. TaxID=1937011 RepID=UPI00272EBC21|nr:hypothetical protein [uncultured Dubosiella sp.]
MAYPFGPSQKCDSSPDAVLQCKHKDTSLAQALHDTSMQSQYDAACKRLLSEKIVLAWILKECVPEYREETIDDIMNKYIEGTPEVSSVPVQGSRIQGGNTEDTDLHEGTIRYDIFFRALLPQGKGRLLLLINVEAQNKENPQYPLVSRMVYHLARQTSSQHGVEFTNDHYGDLQKVYSIWICMNAPKRRANSMNVYEITEKQVAGHVKLKKPDYDLMTGIVLWLGDPASKEYKGIFKMLHTLLSNKVKEPKKRQVLEEEYDIQMSEKMEKEVSTMCNLSQGILEQGIQQGERKGVRRGRQEQRIQDEKKMQRQNIKRMKKLLAAGIDKATIANVFDCSVAELEALSKK